MMIGSVMPEDRQDAGTIMEHMNRRTFLFSAIGAAVAPPQPAAATTTTSTAPSAAIPVVLVCRRRLVLSPPLIHKIWLIVPRELEFLAREILYPRQPTWENNGCNWYEFAPGESGIVEAVSRELQFAQARRGTFGVDA